MPKVSIVIPCYNVENYVKDAIDSAISQTIKDKEIICVDDGSSDSTPAILKKYEKQYQDLIKTIYFEKNRGAGAARNAGMLVADSDFIQFLDADDILMPEKLEKQLKFLEELNKPVDVLFGSYFRTYPDKERILVFVDNTDEYLFLMQVTFGITSSNLYRKSAIIKAGRWDEKSFAYDDCFMMLSLLKTGAVTNVFSKPLCFVRSRKTGSITKTNSHLLPGRIVEYNLAVMEYAKSKNLINSKNELTGKMELFKALRKYYNESPSEAVNILKENFEAEFMPVNYKNITDKYISLYRIFGFRLTEKIYKYFNL